MAKKEKKEECSVWKDLIQRFEDAGFHQSERSLQQGAFGSVKLKKPVGLVDESATISYNPETGEVLSLILGQDAIIGPEEIDGLNVTNPGAVLQMMAAAPNYEVVKALTINPA